MILILYNRKTKECVKRFINPKNDEERCSQIAKELNLLPGFEILDFSDFWSHITN